MKKKSGYLYSIPKNNKKLKMVPNKQIKLFCDKKTLYGVITNLQEEAK